MRMLFMSGSLRAASSNTSLLQAAELLATREMTVEHYEDAGRLPHYNPDLENQLPSVVVELRACVDDADGLLISCPEYARGIPGSFKNVLDWLVGSPNFAGKPVALFNASIRASAAQAALRLVLATMSARIVEEASISVALLAKDMDSNSIANDPTLAPVIVEALKAFARTIDGA